MNSLTCPRCQQVHSLTAGSVALCACGETVRMSAEPRRSRDSQPAGARHGGGIFSVITDGPSDGPGRSFHTGLLLFLGSFALMHLIDLWFVWGGTNRINPGDLKHLIQFKAFFSLFQLVGSLLVIFGAARLAEDDSRPSTQRIFAIVCAAGVLLSIAMGVWSDGSFVSLNR